MSRFETMRQAKLSQIHELGPMVAASLCSVPIRCGNKSCKCAQGEPHQGWRLTYKLRAKTKTVYVPKDMVEEVKEWVKEHKRARELLADVSRNSIAMIRAHTRAKRSAARVAEKKK